MDPLMSLLQTAATKGPLRSDQQNAWVTCQALHYSHSLLGLHSFCLKLGRVTYWLCMSDSFGV
jgi:hypothetical protein